MGSRGDGAQFRFVRLLIDEELRHTVPSYDAWHIAVAEALSLPLATLDKRLSRAKGPICAFLTP